MKRWKIVLSLAMSALLCWTPTAAPFAAYAEAETSGSATAGTGAPSGSAVPAAGAEAVEDGGSAGQDAFEDGGAAVGGVTGDASGAAGTADGATAPGGSAADGAGSSVDAAPDATAGGSDGPSSSESPAGRETAAASAADALAAEHASDLPDGTYVFTSVKAPGRALETRNGWTDAGTMVQIWDSNGTDSQIWTVSHEGPYVVLTNAKSDKPLDLPDGRAVDGNPLRIWDANGAIAQRWIAVKGSDGSIELLSAVDPAKAVDLRNGRTDAGTGVQLYARNGTAAQRWAVKTARTSRDALDALAAAHKADMPDGTYVLASKKDPSKAFAVSNGAVQLADFSAKDAQRWKVTHDAKGYLTLTSAFTGAALDAKNGSTDNGTRLQTYASNGSWAQKWIAVKGASGEITLLSGKVGGVAIDCRNGWMTVGNPLQLYASNGTAAQQWIVNDVSAVAGDLKALAAANRGAVADGTYALVGGDEAARKVLDVAGGSTTDGGNAQLYTSNGTAAQRWRVTHDADGFVTLTSVKSGKALEVAGGYATVGRNVQQWAPNGTAAQKWVFVPQADGSYQILSALWGGLALDIVDGRLEDGVNVRVWGPNGAPAQSWRAVADKLSPSGPGEDILGKGIWGSIVSSGSGGKVIDVANGSTAAGTPARPYADNGTLAQTFSFEWADGYYRVVNAKSGRALALEDVDAIPGARIVLRDRSDDATQLFRAIRNADGTFTLVNKATSYALALTGSSFAAVRQADASAQHLKLNVRANLIVEGVYTIGLAAGSTVLDVANGAVDDLGGIQVYAPNGTFSQKWSIARVSGRDNVYTIEALNSGKRLVMLPNGQVRQQNATSEATQQWSPEISGDALVWRNVAHPDRVLSAAGAGSGQAVGSVNGVFSSMQRWRLSAADAVLPDGVYQIRSAGLPGNVLDVQDGAVFAGANVRVWAGNDTGAQKWNVTRNADGTYTIVNARSHKALDLVDGRASNGTNVRLWEPNGAPAQRWLITYAGRGWRIASAVNPAFVIDAAGGAATQGANIQIFSDNGVDGQRYTFKATSYVQEYIGFQNPSPFFQVSMDSVTIPHMGQGIFGYRTPSRIAYNATKQDCINAMITRAYDYLGTTPYIWDYSCAPGVGVDCAGLVMQALYATGMDLMPFNPWDHYYTPGHDQYANGMWDSPRFMHLDFSQRQRGDLVCYPGHIAIYLGNDTILEAYTPATGVRISNVYSSPNIKGVLRPFV